MAVLWLSDKRDAYKLAGSAAFEYAMWLPLRVFERRATIGTNCERSEHFKQSVPPLVAIASHHVVPPTGYSKVHAPPAGVRTALSLVSTVFRPIS